MDSTDKRAGKLVRVKHTRPVCEECAALKNKRPKPKKERTSG